MLDFYKNKRVLLTGHTGFKGAWLAKTLCMMGAKVTGFALEPPTEPSLYKISDLDNDIDSIIGDIRDLSALKAAFEKAQPDIAIHMAAQPLVRESYSRPVYTYETNVMGTVNFLECVRTTPSVRSVVNVTTDKVYKNLEQIWGYRESDELGGFDPYSNSKACSEMVTDSYIKSFLKDISVSTVRAGNVIGGGDFAADRIVPDCIRAAINNSEIVLRSPDSIRPYQHVLEALNIYLKTAMLQYQNKAYAGNYNVGPDDESCIRTKELVAAFCKYWQQYTSQTVKWSARPDDTLHEAKLLKLDNTKIKAVFGWKNNWNIETAIEKTVEWYSAYTQNADINAVTERQIKAFFNI